MKRILSILVLCIAPWVQADVTLLEVASGHNRPIFLTYDNAGRIYVVEKHGKIYRYSPDFSVKNLYLDISHAITSRGNEQGLLGMAFSPSSSKYPALYLYYTASNGGDNTLARIALASLGKEKTRPDIEPLLEVKDPASNHNGGMIAFGKDGYLYVGLGDGGSGGDPWNNAQNMQTLLGKLVRIDVDVAQGYRIPSDNPYVNNSKVPDEIWAYGLRNPWRFSFDRKTGDLWSGDVGQRRWEEINVQRAPLQGGANYGWRLLEGEQCFDPPSGCKVSDKLMPFYVYSHKEGCSVTGGYVYRGEKITALQDQYIFADYCTGAIWAIPSNVSRYKGKAKVLNDANIRVTSFGEDLSGELYVLDDGGSVYRLESGE